MIKKLIWIIIHTIIKLSILLVFISFYLAIFEKELLKYWVEWLKEIILMLWTWNYLIAFISSLIESFPLLWIALPSQTILTAIAWFFWENNYINLIYIIIIASLWAIFGNFISYFLWVKYWEQFIHKYWMWIGVTKTDVKYLKKSLHKWWAIWIILWKFHPTTRTFLPFVAGMSWMTSLRFTIYNIIGSIVWAITIITLWVLFAQYYEVVIDNAWKVMIWIMLATWFYIWKFKKKEFKKYMQEKNEEMERKYGTK